ncbi:hypothetical protein [Micromonospora zamorensis]|uniref:hypothetical protein n=1 Tax=Micromonospora zamorensis TaxID=709883 RepID=UPI00340D5987
MQTLPELIALCPEAGSPRQAAALVSQLGGAPLLCRLAGAYLARAQEGRAEEPMLGTFTGYRTEVLMRAGAGPQRDAVIGLALERLDDDGLGQAHTLLRLFGVLPDAPVPYQLLLDPALLAESELFAGLTGPHLEALIDGLVGLALVERTAAGELSLDSEIREFANHDGEDSGQRPAHVALLAKLIIRSPRCEVAAAAAHVFRIAAEESGDPGEVDVLADACLLVGDALASDGRFGEARVIGEAVVAGTRRLLGPTHHRTLFGTTFLASWTGDAGDPAAAHELLCEVAAAYGPIPDTDSLVAFANRAYWAAKSGDVVAARDAYAELVPMRTLMARPDDPELLVDRTELARWTGAAGDAVAARDAFAELMPLLTRLLGPDDPELLNLRAEFARWTGLAGDAATARDAIAELVRLRTRLAVPDDVDLLFYRGELAHWTGTAGDAAAAQAMFIGLLPDFVRAFGTAAEDVVALREAIIRWGEK